MPASTSENQPPFGTFRMELDRKVASMVANTRKNASGRRMFFRHTVSMTMVRKQVVSRRSQLTARPYARPRRALVRNAMTTMTVNIITT